MKDYNRIIDIISATDEKIVDRCTEERYRLIKSAKRKKKRFIPIIAIAAAIAILASLAAVILIPMMSKQVPVYTGMTVSSQNGKTASANKLLPLSALIPLDNKNTEGNNGNHGENNPNKKPPKDIEDIIEEPTTAPETTVLPDGTIEVIPTEELYYAKQNEDIFITIHFDNPDDYKIMSFKLNGVPYADYMFEYGSDYENIIIKVNVGNAEGIIDYTIDAIQYADRETLKYVEMKGDPTLSIGVYTEKQPKSEITNEIIGINEVSFDITVEDELGLIEMSKGRIGAIISDGTSIIGAQELFVGKTSSVKFEGLATSTYYQYAIVAAYDAFDGAGYTYHILDQKELTTKEVVAFSAVEPTKTSVDFSFIWNEEAETKEITAIELYLGDTKVKDIDVSATSVGELLSNNSYKLVVSYLNNGKTETIAHSFKTEAKTVPTVGLLNYVSEYEYVSFDIAELSDPDNIGEILKAEIYNPDGTLRGTIDSYTGVRFDDLLLMATYNVAITYRYDLNDGNGEIVAKQGVIVSTATSKGLSYYNENVIGIGSCTDSVLYINSPIRQNAFNQSGDNKKSNITKVILGPGVTYIEERAFYECESLKSIEMFGYVTKIGEAAFYGCSSLSGTLDLSGVKTIEDYTFQGCSSLSGTLDLSRVKTIGHLAFADCSSLEKLINLNNVKEIGSSAFSGCSKISGAIDISSVTSLGGSAFASCENLTGIIFGDSLKTLETYTFYRCKKLTEIDLSGFEEIGAHAFLECEGLRTVTLGKSVKKIGMKSFYGCVSLSGTLDLTGVTSIADSAFANCKSIEKVIFDKDITAVERYVFNGCEGITGELDLVNITTLSENAFQNCDGITSYKGEKLTHIGDYAFDSCSSLSGELDLTKVTYIGAAAFSNCKKITKVTFGEELEAIGDNAFSSCEYLAGKLDLKNVKEIGSYAFSWCERITEVVFSDDLETISNGAFSYCGRLSKLSPMNNLKNIGNGAFVDCRELCGTLDLSNAESIGSTAFRACQALEGVVLGKKLRALGSYAFYLCNKLSGTIDISSVDGIEPYTFGGCRKLEGVVLSDSLEYIRESAFEHCESLAISALPTTLKEIRDSAFLNCAKLGVEGLDLTGAEYIETNAFNGCNDLKWVRLGTELEFIDKTAFGYNLADIYFEGTKAEWESINKSSEWDDSIYSYTVHCEDGDIQKSE